MNRYPALNFLQLKVLNWVNDGCPDGVFDDWSHRLSARALHERGLLTVRGRGQAWTASLTDAGKYYLNNGNYPPEDPRFLIPITNQPERVNPGARQQERCDNVSKPPPPLRPTSDPPQEVRRLLTLSDVAERLQVSKPWLRNASSKGEIPSYKIGSSWRYDPAELEMWLLTVRNQSETPRSTPSRFFTDATPSQRNLKPKDSDLKNTRTAEQIADALQVTPDRVKQWIRQDLVPGRQISRKWLTTEQIATEVIQIVTGRGKLEELPPGRNRTSAATDALEQEMLNRRGIHLTVRSWRYHTAGRKTITWVPAPRADTP